MPSPRLPLSSPHLPSATKWSTPTALRFTIQTDCVHRSLFPLSGMVVYMLEGKHQLEEDEWMYQVKQASESDVPGAAHNVRRGVEVGRGTPKPRSCNGPTRPNCFSRSESCFSLALHILPLATAEFTEHIQIVVVWCPACHEPFPSCHVVCSLHWFLRLPFMGALPQTLILVANQQQQQQQ